MTPGFQVTQKTRTCLTGKNKDIIGVRKLDANGRRSLKEKKGGVIAASSEAFSAGQGLWAERTLL